MQIRKAMREYGDILAGIIEADETYVGGENKNRHADKKAKGSQGRSTKDKVPVFGLLERGIDKVRAKIVKDITKKTLNRIIMEKVKKGSKIMTDEWVAYNNLYKRYIYQQIGRNKESQRFRF